MDLYAIYLASCRERDARNAQTFDQWHDDPDKGGNDAGEELVGNYRGKLYRIDPSLGGSSTRYA